MADEDEQHVHDCAVDQCDFKVSSFLHFVLLLAEIASDSSEGKSSDMSVVLTRMQKTVRE